MIWFLVAIFVVGVIYAILKRPKQESPFDEQLRQTPAQLQSSLASGTMHSKRPQQINVPISQAIKLFTHDNSADEQKLLDMVLEAKLDGKNFIIMDQRLYQRLKTKC